MAAVRGPITAKTLNAALADLNRAYQAILQVKGEWGHYLNAVDTDPLAVGRALCPATEEQP